MPVLPKAELPPGPQAELVEALHALHHRAGWPSLRQLAKDVGCSHTTVSGVFSSSRLPAWGLLQLIVEAMDGDVGEFHRLWLAASAPGPSRPAEVVIAGRREELRVVRGHLSSRGPGLLLVAAEAGMGKTRLVSVAAEAARSETFIGVGAGLPLSAQVPLLPIADALHDVADADEGGWLTDTLAECPDYVRSAAPLLLPELAEPDASGGRDDEASASPRLFSAVSLLLAALCRRRPMALLIEDLHWADSASLDLLEYLVAHQHPVPMVATFRMDDPTVRAAPREWFTRVVRAPTVRLLELAPLSREETAQQISLLRHGSGAPEPGLVDQIYQRSLGQPLFTEQLAVHAAGGAGLPRVLAEVLDRRIDGVGDAAWTVLRALGVSDRPLTDTLLRAATGLSEVELTAALHELDDRRLLGLPASEREAKLGHPLLAEAVRRRLVAGEASPVHRRIAQALGSEPDADPAEVAIHWRKAGESAEELVWTIRAARASASRFIGQDTVDLWRRALALWPPSGEDAGVPPTRKAEAFLAIVEALQFLRRDAEGREFGERALSELRDLSDLERAHLLRFNANVQFSAPREELQDALVRTDSAITQYQLLAPSEGLVDVLALKAGILCFLGDRAKARTVVAETDAVLAQLPASPSLPELMAFLSWVDGASGDLPRALSRMADAADLLAAEVGPQRGLSVALTHSDLLLMSNRSAEEVDHAAGGPLHEADLAGIDDVVSSLVRANLAEAWLRAGSVERAASVLAPLTDRAVTSEHVQAHLMRALLDVVRGTLDDAEARLDAVMATSPSERFPGATAVRAVLDLWRGEPTRAVKSLLPALSDVTTSLPPGYAGELMLLAARAAADAAATHPHLRADELLTTLLDLEARFDPFRPDGLPVDLVATHQWHAELARLTGQDSPQLWERAASSWGARRPFENAYCLWRAAAAARADGQGTRAKALSAAAAGRARSHIPLSAAVASGATSG